jgi:uncharacterized membrane protein YccC
MIFNREPALILTLASSLIALVIGFGVNVSSQQFALIMAAVTAVAGVWIRTKVTPVTN